MLSAEFPSHVSSIRSQSSNSSNSRLSGRTKGAPLKQQGVTHVAHPHGPRVGGQRQLVTGTTAAINVSTVPTVVLQHKDSSQ